VLNTENMDDNFKLNFSPYFHVCVKPVYVSDWTAFCTHVDEWHRRRTRREQNIFGGA